MNKKVQDPLDHARYLWNRVQQSGADVGDCLADLSKFLREKHLSLEKIGVTDFNVTQAKFNAYVCAARQAMDIARRASAEAEEFIDKMDLMLYRATSILLRVSNESSRVTFLSGVMVDVDPNEIQLFPRKLIHITDEEVDFWRQRGKIALNRLRESRRGLNINGTYM